MTGYLQQTGLDHLIHPFFVDLPAFGGGIVPDHFDVRCGEGERLRGGFLVRAKRLAKRGDCHETGKPTRP